MNINNTTFISPLIEPDDFTPIKAKPVDPQAQDRFDKKVNKMLAQSSIRDGKEALNQCNFVDAKRFFSRAVEYAQEAKRLGSAKEANALNTEANSYLEKIKEKMPQPPVRLPSSERHLS